MPIIRFDLSGLDPFAFADADTDEARTFTTYMGYWTGFARAVTTTYGVEYHDPLVAELRGRKPFRSLEGKKFEGDLHTVKALLLNGWNSELGLYLVDDDDPRLMAQNQWNNVFAYYATGRAALAWLLVRDGHAPTKHRPLLRALSALVENSTLLPTPWNLGCCRLTPLEHVGFAVPPDDSVSTLSTNNNAFDMVGKALKTTRKKRLEQLKDEEVERFKLRRAPNGFMAKADVNSECTTVFEFLWRLRTRSNYGDPSMFYVGTLDQARSFQYLDAVRTFTDATMLVFEALVAQRARPCLVEAADHYMSRDRTGITATVLGRRLKALDLLGD